VNRAAAGRSGEDAAAALLAGLGMSVVARNYRTRRGEIDLVALDGDSVVFVEVKNWTRYGFEDLALALTPRKIGRIVETAKIFLARNREYYGMAARFDVVFIGPEGTRHLAHAFSERI
jgi:putative endonuclease